MIIITEVAYVMAQAYLSILLKWVFITENSLEINTINISSISTYILLTASFDEIQKSHCKFIESVRLKMSEDEYLPSLFILDSEIT